MFGGSNSSFFRLVFLRLRVKDFYVWGIGCLRLGVSNYYVWRLVFLRLGIKESYV